MSQPFLLGTLLTVAGALMQGSFALPMKFTRRWAWENTWLVYSVVGLLAVPWMAALMTVPDLARVYASTPPSTILVTVLFGFGWGVANVLFGLAIATAGMSLSFSIVSGMSASLGSLVPLIALTPERLTETSGMLVVAGVLVALAGIITLGAAGRRREIMSRAEGEAIPATKGILLAIAAGTLAPTLNFSFAFGSGMVAQAVRQGADPASGSAAIWALCLAGGFLSNAAYAVFKLTRNRNWVKFGATSPRRNWLMAALMGTLFTGGLLLYGRGAVVMGALGAVVGWPVFQSSMIVTSTCLGALSGEWRGADSRFITATCVGLLVLIAAIVLLSIGNQR